MSVARTELDAIVEELNEARKREQDDAEDTEDEEAQKVGPKQKDMAQPVPGSSQPAAKAKAKAVVNAAGKIDKAGSSNAKETQTSKDK